MIVHEQFFVFFIGSPQRIAGSSGDLAELFVFYSFLRNEGHVMSRRIVLFVGQSMGIGKMCVCTSQFCCTLVHQIGKSLHGARYLFGDSIGAFVGGFQHDCIEAFFYCKNFPFVSGNMAAVILNGIDSIVRESDFFVQIKILQCQ